MMRHFTAATADAGAMGLFTLALAMIPLAGCGDDPAQDSAPPVSAAPATPRTQAPAPADPEIVPLQAAGLLVAPHRFFRAVGADAEVEIAFASVADRALVTTAGVYAFVDSPENQKLLQDLPADTAVRIEAVAHTPSRLLHIERIEALAQTPADLDVDAVAGAAGRKVTLTGTNKCACGIKIAPLHTSCQLGHLHHLEADDGRIYHYLQFADGQDAYLGRGTHFKKLTVEAVELPGQFLLVERVAVQ